METPNYQMAMTTVLNGNKTVVKESTHKEVPTATEIQVWIASYLAELLEIDSEEVDTSIPFDRYGLDSAVAVGLTGDLEDWLQRKLDPTLLYDYPTVEALSKHLAEECQIKA